MRVLWLCNIMLPAIAEKLNMESSVKEGWLTGLLSQVIAEGDNSGIQLGIAFPTNENLAEYQDVFVWNHVPVTCYGFNENTATPENYQPHLEIRFENIVKDFKPDVVHAFGTEYPHTLAMARAVREPKHLLIGMQGLISIYGDAYYAKLSKKVVSRRTFRDIVRKDSLQQQKDKFVKRGKNELRALRITGNVTGRTDFDREYCEKVAPDAMYYPMNETMRPCFYDGKWEYDTCVKHQIFYSQADYPIKGLHFVLEALPEILKKYPDTKVLVAGNNIVRGNSIMDIIKLSTYGKYLKQLMGRKHLWKKVKFVGRLSAEQMKEKYLESHIFLCASALENSPNSVAESMLLGTPVVAGAVGGIPSMIEDGKEGILFEGENPNALAEAVIRLWDSESDGYNKSLTKKISEAGVVRAKKAHDPATNFSRLLEIYRMVAER